MSLPKRGHDDGADIDGNGAGDSSDKKVSGQYFGFTVSNNVSLTRGAITG
ncbi:hypothetical protein LOAG_03624 [Loa loa]|uniref:Uncharacterized protein n=1 Tax=Loa loa TaxID=7209 RepID=A0A1S0U3Q5_LOALO|nr:hypothetical protein LOAG_03624 [Loa loa]EFO24858.1 hypothetical protein LOAG_03624 [Loa loa]